MEHREIRRFCQVFRRWIGRAPKACDRHRIVMVGAESSCDGWRPIGVNALAIAQMRGRLINTLLACGAEPLATLVEWAGGGLASRHRVTAGIHDSLF